MSRGPQNFFIFCLVLRSEEVLVVDRKRWWFSDRKRLLLLLVVRSEEISVVLRSEVDSKASQSGPSEREAEDAPGAPLLGAPLIVCTSINVHVIAHIGCQLAECAGAGTRLSNALPVARSPTKASLYWSFALSRKSTDSDLLRRITYINTVWGGRGLSYLHGAGA